MTLNGTILFLDFDKTVTDIHTGGFPDLRKLYWKTFTNKEMILKLLTHLKWLGCKIYLITRGDQNDVCNYTKYIFSNVFDDIKGNNQELIETIGNDDFEWAKWKVNLMKNLLIDLNHTDISRVFFFDDTQINITTASKFISNAFKIEYGSVHLFELLSLYVLPTTELVYNIPIYNISKLHPPDGTPRFILRKTSDKTTMKVIKANDTFSIINIFTAVYTTHYKKVYGVILDNNKIKRFVKFKDDDFKIDQHTIIINRIRNLNDFMNYIHELDIDIDCFEFKLVNQNSIQINDFV